jgi:glycosyltransferase involved in cell wall biosynthesis
MKIAIATDAWHPQISGVVTTQTHTIRELKRLGHEVYVIHPERYRLTVPCPTYPQIRLAAMPWHGLGKMLDIFQPDAIHIVTEGPIGWACWRHCRRRRLRFTTAFTTRFDEYVAMRSFIPRRFVFRLMRWFHSQAARVMISSAVLKEELEREGFGNAVLWPRGVDTEVFHIRKERFLPDEGPIFLYVGRVAVEKNIEAFLKLDLPGRKYVVGDGPALVPLRAAYPEVRFVGAKQGLELACYYAAADVFVFPSRTDTFGIVMLEAMASGVPVAAYPVRGPIDIVTSGQTGYLSEDLRDAALSARTLDPKTCRDFALQFSWEKSARHFLDNLVTAQAPVG